MKYAACFFDLDGTLCDTAPDILDSWIQTLAAAGLDADVFERKFRIGPPLEPMIRGIFPQFTPAEAGELIAAFRERYCTGGFPQTRPYQGVPELLDALRQDGVKLFIATNKALRATRLILEKLQWLECFDAILTPDSGSDSDHCSKSERLRQALGVTGFDPAHCAMVGDTVPDVEAGRAVGMITVGVGWGYGSVEELRVARPNSLLMQPEDW